MSSPQLFGQATLPFGSTHSQFCLDVPSTTPKPEAWVGRWRREVLLNSLFEDERAPFTLGSQTLMYFAVRRRQVVAATFAKAKPRVPARRQDVERAPGGLWGGRICRPARVGREGSQEAGPEPGSGGSSTESEAEAEDEIFDTPELPRSRTRHRVRCSVGCSGPEIEYVYSR